ncbi:MAG: prepilin-type N-terminal cleavage/methylation domain-containing protein [Phycisphaerae bacterium]|nr:prepilin-type N-terminal cleavage/methylation domain-containing protein [Phycisphaerae bacterium]NUQ08065.1 prepilin-type N-terminal cleavage/methylation domain-containing protein [Phycisphaerae bacterium]
MIAPTDIRRASYPCIAARRHAHLNLIRHSLFAIRSSRCCAFTLLELLVVTVLVALAVGLVTLKLDGLTAAGKVRGVASQVGSYVRLAQIEARTSGEARRVGIDAANGVVRIARTRRLQSAGEDEQAFRLLAPVEMKQGWFDSESRDLEGSLVIRIDGHGRYRRCALLFESQGSAAACVLPCLQPPRVHLPSEKPRAASYPELVVELSNETK